MIYHTTTYKLIKAMTSKIKVIQGGQGAGKNISIAQILIEDAIEKPRTITIVSDTYDNLKDGVIADMKGQFLDMGLDWQKHYNKTDKDLTLNGSVIQFRYVNDLKSHAGKSKRRDILYINEANKIGWLVASTYIGRTHEKVYLDYNPDQEFWAHTEVPKLKDGNGNQLSSQIVVTYVNNEMLPQAEIDYIESRRSNEAWFRVYGLGLTGFYSERRVYKYKFYEELPDNAMRIYSGMDFGHSPDPTILIDVWLEGSNIYVDEVFCLNNLMPERIQGAERMCIVDQLELVEHTKGHPIVADSAGAKEIADMRLHNYEVIGVKKGTGSVLNGVNNLRGYNIFISYRSNNVKKGIEELFFKQDKNGKIIPELQGHEPDGLAALRYVMMEYNRPKLDFY